MSAVAVKAVPWIGGSPITATPWKPVWFGGLQISGPDGEAVCTMWGGISDGADRLQAIANSHMIAAAPDLYDACSAWIAWMDGDGVLAADEIEHETQMLDAMRAALAKARGEA